MENKKTTPSLIDKLANVVKFTTNLSVIVAIIFGIYEISQKKDIERRKIAIEAVAKTRSNDFIKSFTRLKTAYLKNENNKIRFFRERVACCLHDFKDKIFNISKSICFAFDKFDFIIDAFQFSRMNGEMAMVDQTIAVAQQHFSETNKMSATGLIR